MKVKIGKRHVQQVTPKNKEVPSIVHEAGSVVDVDEKFATMIIERGLAVKHVEPQPEEAAAK